MNGKITVQLYTDGCEGTVHHVKYLEHVQARITLKASRRGEIQIYLTSPMMTTSTLLAKRREDASREGFNNWAFMTTHNWGELAKGSWQLVIENGAHSCKWIVKAIFRFDLLTSLQCILVLNVITYCFLLSSNISVFCV